MISLSYYEILMIKKDLIWTCLAELCSQVVIFQILYFILLFSILLITFKLLDVISQSKQDVFWFYLQSKYFFLKINKFFIYFNISITKSTYLSVKFSSKVNPFVCLFSGVLIVSWIIWKFTIHLNTNALKIVSRWFSYIFHLQWYW